MKYEQEFVDSYEYARDKLARSSMAYYHKELVDEAVHNVYIKRSTCDTIVTEPFRNYLVRACFNEMRSLITYKRRRTHEDIHIMNDLDDGKSSYNLGMTEKLQSAVNLLSPLQKTVINYHLKGWSHIEISKHLKGDYEATKSSYFHALHSLRKTLRDV